ncbi:hypothetical protein [Microvirga makkahensis]|uniref:Uncharacterized protein n=1 Tax=Microvirga makkahensis TaxID=1128670 RepID=A0A7X3MWY5_9HYPH|nr:hypothetical protein [Microvirga makkahensis]MXQ14535.1 hypothetical protein [Microvirga makkahensis]
MTRERVECASLAYLTTTVRTLGAPSIPMVASCIIVKGNLSLVAKSRLRQSF